MSKRAVQLTTNKYYHIINRSIAKYKIFNCNLDYQRFIDSINYFNNPIKGLSFRRFINYKYKTKNKLTTYDNKNQSKKICNVICFCLMPTHYHLVLKQNIDNGISKIIADIQNCYTRYFNTKHKRKGPLWVGKFKNALVDNDEQLLHLTRYIHLNPTSACLVNNPQDWLWSSYHEYLSGNENYCKFKDIIDISASEYKKFVERRKEYQKEISKIKKLLLENYDG